MFAKKKFPPVYSHFQELVEKNSDAILIVDSTGVIRFANPAASALFMHEHTELIGKDFGHPVSHNLHADIEILRKDGKSILSEMRVAQIKFDARGSFLVSVRDITERKNAEEVLRLSEERYRSLVTASAQMSWVADASGLFSEDSPSWREFTGQTFEEFKGWGWLNAVHPKDRTSTQETWKKAFAASRTYESEHRIRKHDGTYRLFFGRGVPIFNKKGVLREWVGFCTDVTERKEAEQALRESEERFRQLAENVNAVFWLSSVDITKIFYISPRYEEIWGRSCQSLYDDPASFSEAVHPEDREAALDLIKQGREKGAFDLECRIVQPGGAMRWIRARAFPIHDKEGKIYRLAGIAEDVTEQKKLENQFFQSQKMEAVGHLAGGIAHDFNNLLTVINGYSEIILGRMSSEDPDHEYLSEIQRAGERAAALTKQLLAFSRQQIIEPKIVDMNKLIHNSSRMLRRLIGEDVELIVTPTDGLGRVRLDPSQLDQLVMNLSINARDAMPKGGKLIIETANIELDEEYARQHEHVIAGNYVMLAVTDTGYGMAPEIKNHIFEPFFTTKEIGKGTGLGLATCYGIVKQNGGSIEIYSEVGQGTTFKVYFPRTDKTEEASVRESEVDLRGTETIFLVEDEGALRGFSETVLKKNGYKVIPVNDGESALRFMTERKDKVDLILTDVVMPGMSARDLCDKIKVLRPGLKVLYMSGYTEEAVLRHAIENRSANFLQKPFTVNGLLKKVRSVLDSAN